VLKRCIKCVIILHAINIIIHVGVSKYTGFILAIRFIEHSQTITTGNYNPIANLPSPQFTTACTKCSHSAVSSPVVAWQRLQHHSFLRLSVHALTGQRLSLSTMNSNSKLYCDWRSITQSILVSSPIWGSWPDIYYCSTLNSKLVLFKTPLHGRHRKHSQSQSQSYFTTGGLPPISSSWRRAPTILPLLHHVAVARTV
jgi:hypothetical protein